MEHKVLSYIISTIVTMFVLNNFFKMNVRGMIIIIEC